MSKINVTSKDAIFTYWHPSLVVPITIEGFGKDMMMSFTSYNDVSVDMGASGIPIAWSTSVYPEGKIVLQPNSPSEDSIEKIQSLQRQGIVDAGKVTITIPSLGKKHVLDNFVITSGLQPPNLEARVMDKEYTFNYTPNISEKL